MMPSVESLLECLPPNMDEWVTVKDKQNVYDIIHEILDAHKNFAPYYDEIALFFDGDSTEEICKNIYNFLKRNIRYHEETEDEQTTALPTGILSRRMGDCKHYASFAGGVLDALNRINGTERKWNYRFASYDLFNPAPHHVFVVANDDDRQEEIWIDPTPGAKNQIPVWLIDKKINVRPMALRRQIAGFNMGAIQQIEYVETLPVDETQELAPTVMEAVNETAAEEEPTPEIQAAIETLMHYGVMNDAGEISDNVLLNLSKTLPYDEFELVAQARQTLQIAIADAVNNAATASDELGISYNDAIGSFFSSLWRGVKKVSLSPARNAYLSLVAINAFGMATKLYNAIYNADGTFWQPGQDQLYKKWNSFGGDWHNLNNAIKSGHKKRALLGCVTCDDEPGTMGVAPAIPAWVAVASALIAAITPLVKEILRARQQQGMLPAGVDPNTGLPVGMNMATPQDQSWLNSPLQWFKDHPIETAGIGIGAYFLLTSSKKKLNAVRRKDNRKTIAFVALGGAALMLYLKNKNSNTNDVPAGGGTTTDTTTDTTISPTTNTTSDATNVTPKTTGFLFVRDLMPYYSTTFDAQAYLNRYPDIRQDKYFSQNPLEHYQRYGQYEGRLPSADPANVRYDSAFDPVYYGDRYPDIPQHFGTDYTKYFQHWQQYGQKEGRKPGGAYLILTQ